MFASALRVAIAKAATPEQLRGLETALAKAEALGHIDAAFATRINASKAARGEGPTKLSRAKKAQLSECAADEAALKAQQLVEFEAAPSANWIVASLKSGLCSDVKFWSGAAKFTHAADWHVVEEFVNAKRELLAALGDIPGIDLAAPSSISLERTRG